VSESAGLPVCLSVPASAFVSMSGMSYVYTTKDTYMYAREERTNQSQGTHNPTQTRNKHFLCSLTNVLLTYHSLCLRIFLQVQRVGQAKLAQRTNVLIEVE
jgi:hypothetical protein